VENPEQLAARSRGAIAMTPTASRVAHDVTPPARIPRVDEHECVGCNLCWLVCPVEGSITMDKVDTGRAPETWAERMERR
jgi:dihydropyrimidine dehydrogenase (NAD+) subunit PreA